MNMVKIVCPKCGAEGKLSLVETSYVGPRRCWKCHELFTITIVNNQVRSSEPLSEEEYKRQQEAKKASEKLGNLISSSSQEEPEIPKITPERRRDYTKPLSQGEPSRQEEPARQSTISPPDRFRTFVPLETSSQEEEPKRPAPKNPPDRFRTFIPPAT